MERKEELSRIIAKAQAELDGILEEEADVEEKKASYKLASDGTEVTYAFKDIGKSIVDLVNNGYQSDEVSIIVNAYKYKKPLPFESIYPCPNCGKLHLRIRDEGFYFFNTYHDYRVSCDSCEFVCPAGPSDSREAAAQVFVDWLRDEGYLK